MFVSHRAKLTSPNYPSPSAENLDCTFTVMVPQSLHVAISVAGEMEWERRVENESGTKGRRVLFMGDGGTDGLVGWWMG